MNRLTIRLLSTLVLAPVVPILSQPAGQIEPNAGKWKTWIISSGKDYRVPPPPGEADTRGELEWLRGFVTEKDAAVANEVVYWDSGAPSYRWIELINARALAGGNLGTFPHRLYTYMILAMYDATIAAWDSKYAYNRQRPSALDPTLKTRLPTPRSPSYPSEYAATAAAAAAVLGYFFPAEAQKFQVLAEEAGKSRLYAGLEYPSDYFAGLDLGRRVADAVIARAKADGSDAVWTGTVPIGKCMWVGTNPGNVTGPGFKPFLLTTASDFRPPAPPACDSSEMVPVIAEVRDFPRGPTAFATNHRAMFWQSPEGLNFWPYTYASKWIYEDKLDQNPPRAARIYALIAAAFYDSFIASQDGKFAYWYIRPHQLETSITPIFPVPNFPSYPSNHSTFSATRSEILAYLFPLHADEIRAVGKEAGDSRIWAGIHYQIDNQSGVDLGKKVAQKFSAWAEADGSK